MRFEYALLVAVSVLFMVSGATSIVGGPEPSEGETAITSLGSTASATSSAAVGPNGTEYSHTVAMQGRTQNITEDRIENISYSDSDYSVDFKGHIVAPTPCHVLSSDIESNDSSYILTVNTEHDETDRNGTCAQVLTMIEYSGEFSAQEDFTLEVRHGNQTIRTLEHPGLETDPRVDPEATRKGIVQKVTDWVMNLF